MSKKWPKRHSDRKLSGRIVGVVSPSSCYAPQWPAFSSTSIIAFLGTHIAVTRRSIAQLNVFSFPLLRGLCRAKQSWAGLTHNQCKLPRVQWHHQSSALRSDGGHTGREQEYGLSLSRHCKLLKLDMTGAPWQVSRRSNKLMARSLHPHTAVRQQPSQQRTGHRMKANHHEALWNELCEWVYLWSLLPAAPWLWSFSVPPTRIHQIPAHSLHPCLQSHLHPVPPRANTKTHRLVTWTIAYTMTQAPFVQLYAVKSYRYLSCLLYKQ